MTSKIIIKNIPAMPQTVLDVLRFNLDDKNADSSVLDRIIRPDKGISANLIRMANSAFYGQSGKIKTLKDAITLLGLKASRNLIILQTASDMFGKLRSPNYRLLLHESSILAALVTIDLARPLEQTALRDEAFLLALLHNVGMSVIALNTTGEYEIIIEKFLDGAGSLVQLEQEAFGDDHMSVGVKVFETWKLAKSSHAIVANYDFDPSEVDTISPLHRLVSLSVLLVRRLLAVPNDLLSLEREAAILKSFGKDSQITKVFGGEYYNMIQDHPFYALAMDFD